MRLTLSTTGMTFHPGDSSVPETPCLAVLRIEQARRVLTESPWTDSTQVYIDLDNEQARELFAALDKMIEADEKEKAESEDDEELLDKVYGVEREYPCVHGHFDCAQYERGPCANETYARLLGEKRRGA